MSDDYDREVVDAFLAQEAPPAPPPLPFDTPPARPTQPAEGAFPLPPGKVGLLAHYILGQAMRPVSEVATVAALGIMAGLAGQQWITFTDTGLNPPYSPKVS